MTATADALPAAPAFPPAWDMRWLTPARCRLILAAVLLLGVVFHVLYLTHNCPIDLSGDEAQYWDWSRHLDLSYYSKGPLIAYIIRASCGIFGDNMPAVRFPALLLGVGTSLVTYTFTRRLFGSERLALGAALLNHLVPVFIAGSLLMTIDAPLFFCWGLATYLAALALFDDKQWAWPLIGLAVGIGALGKYAMLLWLPILGGFLCTDAAGRAVPRTAGPWIATAIALLCMTPVVLWNARHHWVTIWHVAHQTGAAGGALSKGNLLSFIGSQISVVGPTLAVLMTAAVVCAFRQDGFPTDADAGGTIRQRRKTRFLAMIGLGFFAFNLLASFMAKVQVNWPAPAYFTLTILTAYFLATRLRSPETWRPWRGWFYATVVIGLAFIPISHDSAVLMSIFSPITDRINRGSPEPKIDPADFDIDKKLRGWQQLGTAVSDKLLALRPNAFVLCDDYQQTAEMAFYVRGQPNTYCAGPYSVGKRLSQYDMWPDRRLDRNSPLVGRDAVYVGKGGKVPDRLLAAFDHVDERDDLDIKARGVKIHTFKTWLCHGFRGFDGLAADDGSESF